MLASGRYAYVFQLKCFLGAVKPAAFSKAAGEETGCRNSAIPAEELPRRRSALKAALPRLSPFPLFPAAVHVPTDQSGSVYGFPLYSAELNAPVLLRGKQMGTRCR